MSKRVAQTEDARWVGWLPPYLREPIAKLEMMILAREGLSNINGAFAESRWLSEPADREYLIETRWGVQDEDSIEVYTEQHTYLKARGIWDFEQLKEEDEDTGGYEPLIEESSLKATAQDIEYSDLDEIETYLMQTEGCLGDVQGHLGDALQTFTYWEAELEGWGTNEIRAILDELTHVSQRVENLTREASERKYTIEAEGDLTVGKVVKRLKTAQEDEIDLDFAREVAERVMRLSDVPVSAEDFSDWMLGGDNYMVFHQAVRKIMDPEAFEAYDRMPRLQDALLWRIGMSNSPQAGGVDVSIRNEKLIDEPYGGESYEPLIEESSVRKRSKSVSRTKAEEIGNELGVDWDEVCIDEFRAGLGVEQEHADGVVEGMLEVGKVALDHLAELPDYYTRLEEIEKPEKRAQLTDDLSPEIQEFVLERLERDMDEADIVEDLVEAYDLSQAAARIVVEGMLLSVEAPEERMSSMRVVIAVVHRLKQAQNNFFVQERVVHRQLGPGTIVDMQEDPGMGTQVAQVQYDTGKPEWTIIEDLIPEDMYQELEGGS